MPHHVKCACGQLLVVPEDRARTSVQCPRCAHSVPIPALDQTPLPSDGPPRIGEFGSEEGTGLPRIHAISRQRWEAAARQKQELNSAYGLAICLVLVALVSVAPLLMIVVRTGQRLEVMQLEPWALAVIFSAILQCVYVVYLVQIPDWSTLRVVSILTLVHATGYAMLAGARILAPPGNTLMRLAGLEDGHFTIGQQAGWCLLLLLLYGTICYVAGHWAGKWHRHWTDARLL